MMPRRKVCYQINLQLSLGGGEIYTRFLTVALRELGYEAVLFVHADARFWQGLLAADARIVPVRTLAEIDCVMAGEGDPAAANPLVITHSALPSNAARRYAAQYRLAGMLHMPLYERFPEGLPHYRRLFAVSEHVIASARSRGLLNVHEVPLYGVADLTPRDAEVAGKAPGEAATGGATRAGHLYDWDRRKVRDRLLGWFEASGLGGRRGASGSIFRRRPGLTLGIVSRITPIKQFPRMFSILAPVLAKFPQVNLEIFGSGGYASIRDLKRALQPMRRQVRLWGQQEDVASIYPKLDYVLSGLPEKEALGLNLIEAQCCNTPVIAVRAPPFTETVVDGKTGFLFEDPRRDLGNDFSGLMAQLCAGTPRPQPQLATEHLARFSPEAFRARLASALDAVSSASPGALGR